MIPIIDRPQLQWPGGKRLALYFGLNIEYYEPGKPSVGILEKAAGRTPDPLNEGWREYGLRAGIWRIMDLFDRYHIRPSVLLNADACTAYPRVIEEGCARGWSWVAHGKNNSMFAGTNVPSLGREEEKTYLHDLLAAIHHYTGARPKGWLGPLGLSETSSTIDLLADEGVTYVLDWINDDQPYPLKNDPQPVISLPYSLEINDLPLFLKSGIQGPEFGQMIVDQLDVLYNDAQKTGRVMAIGLHPFVVGQPFRFKYLEKAIHHICQHNDIWLTTSDDIAEWYLSNNCKSHRAVFLEPANTPEISKNPISTLIESYRMGFLHLDPKQLTSIWDSQYTPLIYVAQEKEEPIEGWTGIRQYYAALPEHVDEMLEKHLEDIRIDILEDTAVAFFISRSSVRLKGRSAIYKPVARVTMIFRRTGAGWRVIHYHESALSAQSAQVRSELTKAQ